jgi:hypothetical protein
MSPTVPTPLRTLLAVAVLGGVLLTANTLGAAAPVAGRPVAATGTAAPTPVVPPARATVPPLPVAPASTTAPATTPPPARPAVTQQAYAGRSSGNEVTVAVAVKDGRAAGYVCDGKKLEAWLDGTVTGSSLTLTSKDGRSTITATLDAGAALGTVTVGGATWPFAAQGVTAPNGLYRGVAAVKGVEKRIGWIVLPDGTQTGLVSDGAAAPRLDPARPGGVTLDGTPVTVTVVSP